MAKWEYLRIEIKSQGKGFTDYQWVVERADGKDIGRNESTIRGTKYPDLDEYLAQIGSEGWELAGTISDTMLLFKRLLAKRT